MSFLLDEYSLKMYAKRVIAQLTDVDQLANYNMEMAKAKRLILDGVRDHIVSHVAIKNMAKEMWDALTSLHQNPSEQWKMFLKEKLRNVLM